MAAKAKALLAILAEGVPPGATINLVAPTRPALVAGAEASDTEESQAQLEP
jgi:hypothetical protein